MKCINPTMAYINADYKRIFRSFSHANDIIKRLGIPFDCGKCLHCRKKKSLELARRCVLHASTYQDNCFLTLTYNEAYIGDNRINYSHIQKFKKRLRKKLQPNKIEIFNVHEYGKNQRKHWHLVIFGYKPQDLELYTIKNGNKIYTSKEIEKLWYDKDRNQTLGYNTVADVTEASAMYQAQYTQKDIKYANIEKDTKSKSNHSGIGKKYFLENYRQILTLGYIPFNGEKMPIPRYFLKIAHKHYCHFNDTSAFFNTPYRKQLYRPFEKPSDASEEMSNLYIKFKKIQNETIKEMEQEWQNEMKHHIDEKNKPHFVIAGENSLYELKKTLNQDKEIF